MLCADAHDVLHFFCAFNEDDRVGGLGLDPGDGVAVLFADRLARIQTVTETLLEKGDRHADSGLVARQLHQFSHGPSILPNLSGRTLDPAQRLRNRLCRRCGAVTPPIQKSPIFGVKPPTERFP